MLEPTTTEPLHVTTRINGLLYHCSHYKLFGTRIPATRRLHRQRAPLLECPESHQVPNFTQRLHHQRCRLSSTTLRVTALGFQSLVARSQQKKVPHPRREKRMKCFYLRVSNRRHPSVLCQQDLTLASGSSGIDMKSARSGGAGSRHDLEISRNAGTFTHAVDIYTSLESTKG